MAGISRKGLSACIVLSICVLLMGGARAHGADAGPIKVGLLLPYTGTMVLQAKDITDAVELAFDQAGRKAGGRPIEVIKEDDENDPNSGITKVRRLVEQQKVDFVIGPVSSAVGLAIHDYLRKQKVIQLNPTAFTRELTSPDKWSKNIFRLCDTSDINCFPMAKWMYKNTPYRNIVLAGSDFAAGHHSLEAFKAGFEQSGGKIVKEVYAKMGTMDFAPFLPAIDVKGADAVYAWFAGTDAVRFVQQYQEFGLSKRLPLYGHAGITDDPYLSSIGDAALGIITSGHYASTLDTPASHAFVNAYKAKYGQIPSRYSEQGYVAGSMVVAVAGDLKGNISNFDQLCSEIPKASAKIGSPSGPLAFDKYNQRIVNMYALKVEKRDGKLLNVIYDKLGTIRQEDVWGWWLNKK